MNRLILIPARSGSTRVPNKNMRMLADKPLVGHIVSSSVNIASARVIVTTNSPEIAQTAAAYGAATPFLRPQEMSGAEAPSLWGILHALHWLRAHEGWIPDMVAFCPPTNPFTKPETIGNMFAILEGRDDINSIVTITQARTHPFRIIDRAPDGRIDIGTIEVNGLTIRDRERSQDWPPVWEGSPACRLTRVKYFESLLQCDVCSTSGKTYDVESAIGYEIDGLEAFDIDDEQDWLIAESLARIRCKPC